MKRKGVPLADGVDRRHFSAMTTFTVRRAGPHALMLLIGLFVAAQLACACTAIPDAGPRADAAHGGHHEVGRQDAGGTPAGGHDCSVCAEERVIVVAAAVPGEPAMPAEAASLSVADGSPGVVRPGAVRAPSQGPPGGALPAAYSPIDRFDRLLT